MPVILNANTINQIPTGSYPLLAFTYSGGWLGNAITSATKCPWSHSMWLHRPGYFASQGWTFHEEPVHRYMDDGTRMVLYEFPHWGTDKQLGAKIIIDKQLKRHGFYDFLGIFGHMLKAPVINNPWRNYCTEAVWEVFIALCEEDPWHPTPKDLWYAMPKLGGKLYGYKGLNYARN